MRPAYEHHSKEENPVNDYGFKPFKKSLNRFWGPPPPRVKQ